MKNIPAVMATLVGCMFAIFSTAQTAAADNKPAEAITFRTIPKGPSVVGVFEGRPPCRELSALLNLGVNSGCEKLKCQLVLYCDSITFRPTIYTLLVSGAGEIVKQAGGEYRQGQVNGDWTIINGIPSNAEAMVYQLALSKLGAYLYLLKGDDNVLFILNGNKTFIPGDEDFSYTLNRVQLVPGSK